MPEIERDGVRVHYSVHGTGHDRPPIILSHGFGASGAMWDQNIDALTEDRRVLTWDMRGHGLSQSPAGPELYGVEQSVGDMLALLETLEAPSAVFGGMSLGGYLSLAFHARHPDRVSALILVDTGPGYRREEPRAQWNAFAERTAAALESDGLSALPDRPETGRHSDPGGLANSARRVMAQHDAHVIESLGGIRVPTLVVVGADDVNFLRPADYMAQRIEGARLVVLERAGHAANIDAAAEFNAAVREFLAADE